MTSLLRLGSPSGLPTDCPPMRSNARSVGIVAVVARPALKTAALLAKNCGPPAAALAVGAASAYLSKHCKAIAPFFLDFTCDLLF